MASIDPSSPIQFNFKKFRNTTASQLVTLDTYYAIGGSEVARISNVSTYNVPNWLSITMAKPPEGKLFFYNLGINSNIANNLQPRVYSQEVEFRWRGKILFVESDVKVKFLVNLTVSDTIRLSLTPTVLNFSYTIGGQLPPKNFLSVTSENPWSLVKDQSWVTVNRTTGSGNGTIEVGADVAGLSAGNYTGLIQVEDTHDKKNVTVNLQVKGETTAEDYLTLAPQLINVVVNQGETVTIQKGFNVSTSEDINITSDAAWAVPDSDTLTANDDLSVIIMVQDTEGLAVGAYVANITIQSSYSTVVGQIVLTVNETLLDGVVDDGFYYADDRNEIKLNSQIPDSELRLEFLTTVGNALFSYPKTAPFFKGVGKSILGTEAKNLISPQTFTAEISSQVVRAVDVLQMRISAYDRIKSTTQQTLRKVFDNVRVITGETPKDENWLTYMPKTLYSFPGGLVCFNFKADAPPENIKITGAATANILVQGVTGDVFTCYVNLSEFDLIEGDEIDIFCGGHSVKVHIRDIEPEITPIVFLNEWHCPEIFTCSGVLEVYPEKDQITAKYFRNGKERTEVLDTRLPESYRLNTGFIWTLEERKWISKILRSPKIWIWLEGRFVEVICTNNQMRSYRTREYFNGFELNFDKSEK